MKKVEKYFVGAGVLAALGGLLWSLLHRSEKRRHATAFVEHKRLGLIEVRLHEVDEYEDAICGTKTRVLVPADEVRYPTGRLFPGDLSNGLKDWRRIVTELMKAEKLV